jgi:hypothetical protein
METNNYAERRRSERIRGATPIHFAIASEDYEVEHEGMTMDRSPHGLRIRTSVPLSCGEAVVVLSLGGSRGAIPARVLWVRDGEPRFEAAAGLKILDSLPR